MFTITNDSKVIFLDIVRLAKTIALLSRLQPADCFRDAVVRSGVLVAPTRRLDRLLK